jgi:hypothetical protein
MSNCRRPLAAAAACLLATLLLFPAPSLGGMFLQSYQATGNLQVVAGGAANLGIPAMGNIMLPSPALGVIKKAFLYATQTNNTLGLSATFNGAPLGTAAPFDNEALLITVSAYKWDVTAAIIPGATSYSVSFLDGMGMHTPVPGAALVVVWEDISTQPTRTVTIMDGIKQVGENGVDTESMSFGALPPGNTAVWIFTTDDDASTGESVVYNGAAIGGPLVGNLGLNASVLQMSGTSNSTSNTLSISTVSDHFSWVMGATAADVPPVANEERTWGAVKALYR